MAAVGTAEEPATDRWSYWLEVYNDPVANHDIVNHNADNESPRVAEFLSGERLKRTAVAVENCPEGVSKTTWRNLFESRLGAACILDLKPRRDGKMVVLFYESSTARRAVEIFDGLMYEQSQLRVGFALPNGDVDESAPHDHPTESASEHKTASPSTLEQTSMIGGMPSVQELRRRMRDATIVAARKQSTSRYDHRLRSESTMSDATDTLSTLLSPPSTAVATEPPNVVAFNKAEVQLALPNNEQAAKSVDDETISGPIAINLAKLDDPHIIGEICRLLDASGGVLCFDDMRIHQALCLLGGVGDAYLVWKLGAFRCCPQFCLVGPYITRPLDEVVALQRCRDSGQPLVYCDPWEPMAPGQIDNMDLFVRYMESMVSYFGPIKMGDRMSGGDARWAYLFRSLPSVTMRRLVSDTNNLSRFIDQSPIADIICLHKTIYSTMHRRMVVAVIKKTRVGAK